MSFRPADHPCPGCRKRALRWVLTYMAPMQTQNLRCSSCGALWTKTAIAAAKRAA